MSDDNNVSAGSPGSSTEAKNDPGLPPVAPPSGRFIIQLFLVPGLIVALVLGFLMAAQWFFGTGHTPEDYLKQLNDDNPQVRWRAAENLGRELPNNRELASNVPFALALAERLQKSTQANDSLTRGMLSRWSQTKKGEREDFLADRQFVQYLIACQGHFLVPVSVEVLAKLAATEQLEAEIDPQAQDKKNVEEDLRLIVRRRRHKAVFSLASLGDKIRQFTKLPPERQQAIVKELEDHASSSQPTAKWARLAVELLQQKSEHPRSREVIEALAKTADGPDPFLRLWTAYALYVWDGPQEAGVPKVEDILEDLINDDGHGVELLEKNEDLGERSEEQFAREIKYQAVASLASHGSPRSEKYLDVLKEMLDEQRQRENARVKNKNQQMVTNTDLAQLPVLLALKAVEDLHKKQPALAKQLSDQVERLTKSSIAQVQAKAKELSKKLR